MRITEKQLQSVLKNLKSGKGYQKCIMCGDDTWNVADTLFELREYRGGGLSTRSAVLPMIIVTCNTCGCMHFVNAISLGLVTHEGTLIEEANSE